MRDAAQAEEEGIGRMFGPVKEEGRGMEVDEGLLNCSELQ